MSSAGWKKSKEISFGGGFLANKIHLVNWSTVSLGKEKGGLGIRRFDLLNRALLGKWA